MKACKHYSYNNLGDETYILQSDGHSWNAFIRVYEKDRLIYSSFQSGLYWDYLLHLAKNKECRREAGKTKKEVIAMLKEITKEWKKVTG
jgi:hypothetical protein